MIQLIKAILPLCFVLCGMGLSLKSSAQNLSTARERVHLFAVGTTHLYDSYLSPLDYEGLHVGYTHMRMRQNETMKREQWFDLVLNKTENETKHTSFYDIELQYAQNWHYLLQPQGQKGDWRFSIGPEWAMHFGGTYSTRNGNNPAQARLALNVAFSALAEKTLRWKNKTFRWRSQIDIPILGLMFAPDYGQSYYEIFELNNYDNNLRITTPFNAPSWRLLSTISFPVNKTALLSVGYKADIRQSAVNHLKRHAWHHALVVGWTQNIQILGQ